MKRTKLFAGFSKALILSGLLMAGWGFVVTSPDDSDWRPERGWWWGAKGNASIHYSDST